MGNDDLGKETSFINSKIPSLPLPSSTPPIITGNNSLRVKILTTSCIYFCTFSYGCGINCIAPAIIEFSRKFNTEISHVSLVLTVLTGSYVVGALLSGVLYNFINRHVIVICFLSCAPTALFLLPGTTEIKYFFLLAGCLGFGGGGWDTAQISWIIHIWGSKAPPFILSQHFCYSLGMILPPLILGPYLRGSEGGGENITLKAGDLIVKPDQLNITNNSDNANIIYLDYNSTPLNSNLNSTLYTPFIIAGSLASVAVIVQILLFLCTFDFTKIFPSSRRGQKSEKSGDIETKRLLGDDVSRELKEREKESSDRDFENKNSHSHNLTPLQEEASANWRRGAQLIVLSCIFVTSFAGLELSTMQFLPTFAVYSKAAFTEAQGAQLLLSCNLAYCVCRGVGILLVLKIRPHFILFGNIVLLVISNTVLFVAVSTFVDTSQSKIMLWGGSVLIGCAMSTTYPAYYAFIEKYIFISNGVSTIITVSAGLVSAIYPIIVGGYVELNPSIMISANFTSISVLVVAFAGIFCVTWVKSWKENNL